MLLAYSKFDASPSEDTMCPDNDSEYGPRTAALIASDNVKGNGTPPGSPLASRSRASETDAGAEPEGADPKAREAKFLDSLAGFARQHQASRWSGTLASYLETIVRSDPQRCTRTSHQYVWDMLRAHGHEDETGVFRC